MDVRALQTALKAESYYVGEIDGLIGPKTLAAIRAFQAARGLVVDGIVGPATLAALGGKVEAPAPPTKRPIPGVVDLSGLSQLRVGKLSSVKGFIVHHTAGGGSATGVVSVLNERKLGVQYVMDRAGHVYQTLPDLAKGYHLLPSELTSGPGAGLSNGNCMGMEVIAKNDADVLPVQVEAAKAFLAGVAKRFKSIVIFGHGEVNPHHKQATEGLTIAKAVRGPDYRIKPELVG